MLEEILPKGFSGTIGKEHAKMGFNFSDKRPLQPQYLILNRRQNTSYGEPQIFTGMTSDIHIMTKIRYDGPHNIAGIETYLKKGIKQEHTLNLTTTEWNQEGKPVKFEGEYQKLPVGIELEYDEGVIKRVTGHIGKKQIDMQSEG